MILINIYYCRSFNIINKLMGSLASQGTFGIWKKNLQHNWAQMFLGSFCGQPFKGMEAALPGFNEHLIGHKSALSYFCCSKALWLWHNMSISNWWKPWTKPRGFKELSVPMSAHLGGGVKRDEGDVSICNICPHTMEFGWSTVRSRSLDMLQTSTGDATTLTLRVFDGLTD